MNVSQTGIKLIQSYEGCRLKAYKPVPTEKYWTIGWGHFGPDIREGQAITQAKADEMLVNDLQKYVNGVNALKLPVNQNQFDALVSFAYNCGIQALASSTLCQLLSKKDYAGAAREFLKWVHSGKTVLPGLVKRRTEEMNLFLKPVPVMKKEDIDMLEKAIVINGFADFATAEPLANRLQAPIYTRAALGNRKVSKELYVVGGNADGLQADKIIPLTGADRYDVAASVKKFLG
jgi:GH24 family phage-related lysozyme (muramidase)